MKMKIFYFFLCAIFLSKVTPLIASEYYCPRSNLSLDSSATEEELDTSFGGSMSGLAFMRTQDEFWREGMEAVGRTFIKLEYCTTKEQYCAHVTIRQMNGTYKKFMIFLPKKIQAGKSYVFNGMNAVVTPAGNPIDGPVLSKHLVQVTLWQKIEDVDVPMKFQVEHKRGIVLWDGIDFWAGKYGIGELCILNTPTGLFPDIKVSSKIHYPKYVREALDF
jgi:hypothetical protein